MRAFLVVLALCVGVSHAFPAQQQGGDLDTAQQQHAPQGGGPPRPAITWGKCPQLQPSDNERRSKALVIEDCLKNVPFRGNENATEEEVVKHREEVTTCALRTEGWFAQNGAYKFDRARSEILNKKLPQDVERQVLAKHSECQKEAEDKYQQHYVPQVQMYQACMDFHISSICGIEVSPPQGYQQGPPPQQQQQQHQQHDGRDGRGQYPQQG
jgi:hypothetical protein